MASTETYTEAKQMEQQHSEPHIFKSTVLKVSIHCEGCKRKVKKILQGVHGVYDINIDLRQQKVVVTGNVTSDILIRKLTKAGKHVELWPEQPASKNNNNKKKKQDEKPEKQNDPENSEENDTEINQSDVNDNETGKVKVDETSKNVQSSSNTAKNNDGSGAVTGTTGAVQVQEPKVAEVRQTVVLPAGPVPEKKVNVAVQFPNENEEASANEKFGGANNSNGGGNKKKKKKGKVMNNNNGNESVTVTAASTATVNVEHCGEAPVNAGSGYRSQGQGHFQGTVHPGSVPFSNPANESPPRHHMHYQQHPSNYYAPPPVHATASVCTVSHHTAYPSSGSYGAAYYAPPQPYSYAHVVRPGTGEMEPRPYTYESESYSYTSSSQPSDSFEFFSDENPNACSVM